MTTSAIHHIELWTADLERTAPSFEWIFEQLGWVLELDADWPQGRIWRDETGVYVVLEQSPDVVGSHDRLRAGMNHIALNVGSPEKLDRIRAECTAYGWTELFADRYPHAGGPDHYALSIENAEGFEFELVADF